jgi:hypothetical protein
MRLLVSPVVAPRKRPVRTFDHHVIGPGRFDGVTDDRDGEVVGSVVDSVPSRLAHSHLDQMRRQS